MTTSAIQLLGFALFVAGLVGVDVEVEVGDARLRPSAGRDLGVTLVF